MTLIIFPLTNVDIPQYPKYKAAYMRIKLFPTSLDTLSRTDVLFGGVGLMC